MDRRQLFSAGAAALAGNALGASALGQTAKPAFRKQLAEKIKDTMNEMLEKLEDFGGIEEVFFTSFVMQ